MMYEISILIDNTSIFRVATRLLSELHLMHKADGDVESYVGTHRLGVVTPQSGKDHKRNSQLQFAL